MKTPRKPLAVALVISLVLLACSSEDETQATSKPAAPADSAQSSESETATGAPASEQAAAGKTSTEASVASLKAKMPEDLPFYPTNRLDSADELKIMHNSSASGISMLTGDSAEEVVTYYKEAVRDQDWEIEMDMFDVESNSGVVEAWKGDRKLMVLTVSNGVDPTAIAVKIMKDPSR